MPLLGVTNCALPKGWALLRFQGRCRAALRNLSGPFLLDTSEREMTDWLWLGLTGLAGYWTASAAGERFASWVLYLIVAAFLALLFISLQERP